MRAVALALCLLASGALAHGIIGIGDPGTSLCACATRTNDLGQLDPCGDGSEIFELPPGAGPPAPAEAPIVYITKVRRLAHYAREDLANPWPYP